MKKILIVGFFAALLSGCASIVSKSEYSVAIATSPATSNFVIKNKKGEQVYSGITPASVNLKASSGFFSGQSYTIHFSKAGYPEKTFNLTSSIDGWYFGNIIFGGLIGLLVVDPASGAMYKLPKTVDVTLDSPVSTVPTNNDLVVATIDTLTDFERTQLVKVN